MCGIAGFWSPRVGMEQGERESLLGEMVHRLRHRGPDASGTWHDFDAGISLGHARLSVIDLSEEGRQPMESPCGRFVLTYNGEVYNYPEIRQSLQESGISFHGSSDTEVVLAAVREWGVDRAVQEFAGMYAFALWDRRARMLTLCRDRVGIKPLYYYWDGHRFAFASELKAFHEGCRWGMHLEVNRGALALLLRHNCIPAPYSIYTNVHKLRPGHLLRLGLEAFAFHELDESKPYWDAKAVMESRGRNSFSGTPQDAVEQLDLHLRSAVQSEMISDVPLGAFLSGGIDSSTVVALMQSVSAQPVKTFSIGLLEPGFNEAEQAKAVAEHLKTDHCELYVTARDAQAVIPRLPTLYDEPFSDSSQIPTFLVSQLARQQVTVALSGDGGDELFGGYNRYNLGQQVWRRFARIPRVGRSLAKNLLTLLSEGQWDRVFDWVRPVLPHRLQLRVPGYRAHRLAEVLECNHPEEMYWTLVSHWKQPESVVVGGTEPLTDLRDPKRQLECDAWDFRECMMYLDFISYLPNDVLTKVDRASMGVALEVRVPILNHRVVEFAWSLPLSYKIRDGEGKWVLRRVLEKYLPARLFDRPKTGFGIPVGDWLRGDLRDWAEELLNEGRLKQEGYFEAARVRELWESHLSGRGDWRYLLWDVLMFQAWLAESK